MNELEYLADRRRKVEERRMLELKKSERIEFHHVAGRINSDETIPLCMGCHGINTTIQNSIPPKQRIDTEISFWSSMIGLSEIQNRNMRIFRERRLKELESIQNG